MKITVEQPTYGTRISVEREGDDHNVTDVAEMFRSVMLAMGFHPASLDQVFDLEGILAPKVHDD